VDVGTGGALCRCSVVAADRFEDAAVLLERRCRGARDAACHTPHFEEQPVQCSREGAEDHIPRSRRDGCVEAHIDLLSYDKITRGNRRVVLGQDCPCFEELIVGRVSGGQSGDLAFGGVAEFEDVVDGTLAIHDPGQDRQVDHRLDW